MFAITINSIPFSKGLAGSTVVLILPFRRTATTLMEYFLRKLSSISVSDAHFPVPQNHQTRHNRNHTKTADLYENQNHTLSKKLQEETVGVTTNPVTQVDVVAVKSASMKDFGCPSTELIGKQSKSVPTNIAIRKLNNIIFCPSYPKATILNTSANSATVSQRPTTVMY